MKVTDQQILNAVWRYQVANLAGRVVHRYVGGRYGLCVSDEFYFRHCSAISTVSRHLLGVSLGNAQMLRRLKGLRDLGQLVALYGDRFTHFYLDGPVARNVFDDARQWWLGHDMPEGIENGVCLTAFIEKEDFKRLTDECAQHLIRTYVDSIGPSPL